MAASATDISTWFDRGVESKSTHMIVVCDTYDHDDYPAYVGEGEDFYERYDHYNGKNMQRIMEVYDLKASKAAQMAAHRAWNLPPRLSAKAGAVTK